MSGYARFKDHPEERRIFQLRALIAFLLVLIAMGGLLSRMYFLQVVENDRYSAISDKNRVQLKPEKPTRGLIFDRSGVLIADNKPSYNVTILKEEVGKDLDAIVERVSKIIPLSARDLERFNKRLKRRRRPFESVLLRSRLSSEEIARLSVNYHRLPGVRVESDLIRVYPYGETLVHAMGYVGRINEKELNRVDERNYAATNYIGKLGIEKYYEKELHGTVGMRKVETNARGRVMRVLEKQEPITGKDLQLTIDLPLQQVTEKLLVGEKASVVAIDPKTGGILALVSTPGYDPNLFVTGISNKDYNALRESPDLPLFNRAIRGGYPPGSTIKPITALAAIDSGSVPLTHTVYDPGWYTIADDRYKRKYRDWKRGGHGKVNLNLALAQSCDVWFYDAAHKTGVDNISHYMDMFGLGKVTSLDLPEAIPALLPTKAWKKRRYKQAWYPGDSLNLSIGQGYLVTTPLQLATTAMLLANRGVWKQPKLLKGFREVNKQGVVTLKQPSMQGRNPQPENVKLNNDAYWDDIIAGMVAVVNGRRGTARKIGKNSPYIMAGKTGTAQVVGIKQGERYDKSKLKKKFQDHALFIAFAPVDNPKIAIAVVVENGGGGSSTAAPLAKKIMDAYLLGVDPEQQQWGGEVL
ncbi:MAG: penicillin-binding protein 2 [Oceanospirillaceae bacterium]